MKNFILAGLLLLTSYCGAQQGGFVGPGGSGTFPNPGAAGTAPVSNGSTYQAVTVATLPTTDTQVLPTYNASSCGTSTKPSWCSGTEMGAWVNSAIAQLAGNPGKINIDNTVASWSQSTQITMPLNVQLECNGAKLAWQNTSGVDIAVAGVPGSSSSANTARISNCYFIGTGSVSTSTSIGVYMGGDPAGTITPSTYAGAYATLDNVKIYGFNTGWTNGNNVYIVDLHHVQIADNYNNVISVGSGVSGVTNSGENLVIDGGSVIGNAVNYGMYFNGFNNRWHITDTSFDYNVVANIFGDVNADFKSVHFESASQCMLSVPSNGSVNMHFYGGDWYIGNSTTNSAFICLPSRNSTDVITFDGGIFAGAGSGATVTNFIYTGAATALSLCPGFTPVLFNSAIAPASFLVDSGSTTCSGFGSSAAANFTFNSPGAVLGVSNVLLQGNMNQSGGTGTTLVPFLLIQPGGPTAVSTWTNTGTVLGINAPNGYAGVLMDFRVGGGSTLFRVGGTGQVLAVSYGASTVCVSATSPAACAGGTVYSNGFVAVPAGGTTLVVNTLYQGPGTVTSANTEIYLQFDSSLSTKLGITCDTAIATPTVSARNLIGLGGSFTITMSAAPTSGTFACISWHTFN